MNQHDCALLIIASRVRVFRQGRPGHRTLRKTLFATPSQPRPQVKKQHSMRRARFALVTSPARPTPHVIRKTQHAPRFHSSGSETLSGSSSPTSFFVFGFGAPASLSSASSRAVFSFFSGGHRHHPLLRRRRLRHRRGPGGPGPHRRGRAHGHAREYLAAGRCCRHRRGGPLERGVKIRTYVRIDP